jgi:hypothetical protein
MHSAVPLDVGYYSSFFCRMLVLHRRLEILNAIRHQYLVVVIDKFYNCHIQYVYDNWLYIIYYFQLSNQRYERPWIDFLWPSSNLMLADIKFNFMVGR